LVAELGSSGALGEHLAKDLQHGVERVQRALEEGDGEGLLDALGHLQDKVEKGLDRGEIAPEDARRLDEATRELASTVDADSDESD
jgi:hypothetical protein